MWHCRVDGAYPWLSDWIRIQWVLRNLVAHEVGESNLRREG